MHLAHRRPQPARPLPVDLAELAVAIAVGVGLGVLLPEELQGDPDALQLAVDPPAVRPDPVSHRVAISNNRLLRIGDRQVSFHYTDYRDGNQRKTMTLTAQEFIRRFLLHVLPPRFHRIRYYGFLANRARQQNVAHCRQLLNAVPPPVPVRDDPTAADYRDRYEALTGRSLRACPRCQHGRMSIIESLVGCRDRPPILDTS